MDKAKQILKYALAAIIVAFIAIQFVPLGRAHSNPPIVSEPNWDSQQTRDLAARACFDCHSNEVKWPWYSNVAPISWSIEHEVEEGREHLNFSDWGNQGKGGDHDHGGDNDDGGENEEDESEEIAEEIREEIEEGKMPPSKYLLLHPEARLSDAETQQLIEGLMATVKNSR